MSTHVTQCIVCGKDCYCSSDLHALGLGGSGSLALCGGCYNPPFIEFCSEDCFHLFEKAVKEAWENYQSVLAEDQ